VQVLEVKIFTHANNDKLVLLTFPVERQPFAYRILLVRKSQTV
jgi:hypothetical protein